MKLLEPTTLGPLNLINRVVMAPMTRSRANEDRTANEMMVTYYRQRATVGLLISEGVLVSEQAAGGPRVPGIYNQAQMESWKNVTEAVHQEGGKIFMQLWHLGRATHSSVRGGILPVGPSAIRIEGHQFRGSGAPVDFEIPTALTTNEIGQTISDFARAAARAIEAGFDGVELHSAFGYLPNQFLVDGANHRTDDYGGSIENRSRFVLEVMDALVKNAGPGKVGIKLSPTIPFNGMVDSDPEKLFSYLLAKLNELPLAYLHLMQSLFPLSQFSHWPKDPLVTFGPKYHGQLITNGKYTRETAEQIVSDGKAALVSFGALLLANPDLVERFKKNGPYNQPDPSTFYHGGEKGYTDYPRLEK